MSRILDVYLHERLAGKLIQDEAGQLTFQYDEFYIDSKTSAQISVSMPLQAASYTGKKVQAFFSGILPDDKARRCLAQYLGISEKNSFALLEAVGGECAGAISFYPEGEIPSSPHIKDLEKLDNKKLKEILELLKRRPLMIGTDNIRLSLAGAQDKLAVGMLEGGDIALVRGTMPTSHILKPMMENLKDTVQNEFFCLKLAARLKINVPTAEIRWLEETPYFLIERYDRQKDKNQMLKRLHQEDFCQALGIVPEMKYENEGGAKIAQCFELLQQYSLKPAADQLAFIQRLIFNYLIGNADAHGKNYSLLYVSKRPVLAPAYDLLSTTVYPNLSSKMAMKIGGQYDPNFILLHHWHRLVSDTKAAKKGLEKELVKLSKACLEQAYDLKISLKNEGIQSSIFEDICHIINLRSKCILDYFND